MASLAPAGFARAGARGARGVPAAAVGSFLFHALLGAVVVWAGTRWALPAPAEVYRVDLVAAPRPPAPRTAAAAAQKETPKPRPPEEPTERAKLKKAPETAPVEVEEAPKEAEPKPAETKKTLEKPNADETIRLEGAPFPYPEYTNNLVVQVKRRWRPPTGPQRPTAEIAFVIHKSGTVTDIEWVRRSGSFTFDLEARGAIETAARQQAFGPLPDGYPADQLRVVFLFDPARY